LGAIIYLCLHGEPPPTVEARRQGASLSLLSSADKASQSLQAVAAHCLQLNPNLRPKSTTQILNELDPFWITQTTAATERTLENTLPKRAISYTNPKQPSELRPLLTKPTSLLRSLLTFLCAVGAVIGLVYGGYIAYENYDLQQAQERKQDNLLFSQSQTIEDYKNYLNNCITCENQQRAMERIVQLEQEQQALLSQQKQLEQEALLFSNAQTLEDFKTYLSTCVQCADKPKAEEKVVELNETLKLDDEKQLAEQEKAIIAALKSKGSSTDFYQKECPKNISFWQRTAEQGYAVAQLLLGGCYRSGDGIKQDYVETLKWYRKAADQGNAYAQNNLGMMYQSGYGTEKNNKEAAKWYRKAAEQNQANAQYLLGVMYEKGQGVPQDDKQAVQWYLRAVEQENPDAQYSLGVMYHYGSGVTQDYQVALVWYQKAAEQGHDKAQYLLGMMYENGYGVDADNEEALAWYKKAAAQGNAEAKAQLKIVESKKPESFSAE
jgi:TPR repeat protein